MPRAIRRYEPVAATPHNPDARAIRDAGCGPRITTHPRKAEQSITMNYNAFGAKKGAGRHSAGNKGHDGSVTPAMVIAHAPNRV
jgi:hypothetical protein